MDRVHLSMSLADGCSLSQAAHDRELAPSSLIRGWIFSLCIMSLGHPEFRVGCINWKLEASIHNADNCVVLFIEAYSMPDNIRYTTKLRMPKRVADHHRSVTRLFLITAKTSAHQRTYTQRAKNIRADYSPRNTLRRSARRIT